jgi:hypothetical protein
LMVIHIRIRQSFLLGNAIAMAAYGFMPVIICFSTKKTGGVLLC